MKLGLRLAGVLMVLPIVVGVQKPPKDSLYTDLTIGAGEGSYANTYYTRTYSPGGGGGCDGGGGSWKHKIASDWIYQEHHKKIGYKDAGTGVETRISEKAKLGLRTGYIKDTRVQVFDDTVVTFQNKTSYIFNPHLSFDWSSFGFGLGVVVTSAEGLYYPSFKAEDYFNGKGNTITTMPSYHLRLGNPKYVYTSISYLENVPIVSGGGYLNYGIGTEAIPYISLWVGAGHKKPFEKNSILVKAGIKLSRNLALNFAYRSDKSNGYLTNNPIKENAFSVKMNYRFFR
jgi:hypothetical protein